ncbi:MAG: glycosyltransferase [Deltaproteobacteria bacterium]|nr:glycosyltransferase [Deltaproteobacteria bacterium]
MNISNEGSAGNRMPSGSDTIRVCYILSYRSPEYVRTASLLQALRRIHGIEVLTAVNEARGIRRYAQTLRRLLALKAGKDPDCYILGFRGYELFWIVRMLTRGKPLILDHLMSPYDSLVHERKRVREGGVIAGIIRRYERSILRHADIVLTDTPLHRSYLSGLFGVDAGKIRAVPVGTDEELFRPASAPVPGDGDDLFRVLFYGSFLPLHGIDVILEAARILRDTPIRFTVIGGRGRPLRAFHDTVERLGLDHVAHRRWVPYRRLPGLIREADVCLGGPFGGTGQARRVVTGKALQALAMGKAVIVGAAADACGFQDRENCLLVPQGDGEELARAIRWCFENRNRLPAIGEGGLRLYRERFSIGCIQENLRGMLVP